jgi:dethiobiotin synthetase
MGDHHGSGAEEVAEGAGGIMVPINGSEFMIDFIAALGLPVLVIARSSLGTINHTLMTVEILRRRKLDVAGVIMVGPQNAANREAIERFGSVVVVDEMPQFPTLTPDILGQWATTEFDPRGQLTRYFQ